MADLPDEDACARAPDEGRPKAPDKAVGPAPTPVSPAHKSQDASPQPEDGRSSTTSHAGDGNATHARTGGAQQAHSPAGNRPRNDAENSTKSKSPNHGTRRSRNRSSRNSQDDYSAGVYGALDLGTNNCRLLLARPSRRGFRVIDAFSRIIRLGEGVSLTGKLSPAAMQRTIEALKVCSAKMDRSQVSRARLVATQACRIADNADEFLQAVRDQVGLNIEILTQEDEARLAVSGCASLIDPNTRYVLVFDIGGGSSELVWLDLRLRKSAGHSAFIDRLEAQECMVAWTSLPVGVVTLAEHFGTSIANPEQFDSMVAHVQDLLEPFENEHGFKERIKNNPVHLLGTSGTITTVAGIKLGLPRYDRNRVDGCWLTTEESRAVTDKLLSQTFHERLAEPCIGHERADLVLAGCAILEALMSTWPCERMRVADRGLREGILASLMSQDGVYRVGRRRGGRRRNRS